jgi:hypothetical protein
MLFTAAILLTLDRSLSTSTSKCTATSEEGGFLMAVLVCTHGISVIEWGCLISTTGTLTLPRKEIAEEFIRHYSGAAQLIVNGRQIFVAQSKKDLRQDVVERLRRTIYRDPQSEAEIRLAERAEQLSAKVPLYRIEQGWVKRNSESAFSSEFSIDPELEGRIKVCYNIDSRINRLTYACLTGAFIAL